MVRETTLYCSEAGARMAKTARAFAVFANDTLYAPSSVMVSDTAEDSNITASAFAGFAAASKVRAPPRISKVFSAARHCQLHAPAA